VVCRNAQHADDQLRATRAKATEPESSGSPVHEHHTRGDKGKLEDTVPSPGVLILLLLQLSCSGQVQATLPHPSLQRASVTPGTSVPKAKLSTRSLRSLQSGFSGQTRAWCKSSPALLRAHAPRCAVVLMPLCLLNLLWFREVVLTCGRVVYSYTSPFVS